MSLKMDWWRKYAFFLNVLIKKKLRRGSAAAARCVMVEIDLVTIADICRLTKWP